MESTNVKTENVKRRRLNGTYRWSEAQTADLLHSIADKVKINPELFEKPTAQRFYDNISETTPSLKFVKWDIMRSKMRHLKNSYMAALKWKKQTGAGLLENGEEKTVTEYLNKICPHIVLLESIFSKRVSIQPPVMFQTSQPVDEIETTEENCKSNEIEVLADLYLPEPSATENSISPQGMTSLTLSPPTPLSSTLTSSPLEKKENKKNCHKSSSTSLLLDIQKKKITVRS